MSGGLLVVTVVSGNGRADLALPESVPVADLLPDLAGRFGLLDPDRAHGGYRLLTSAGRLLAVDRGLGAQEVGDGAVLILGARLDRGEDRVHDDPAEALAEVVADSVVPASSDAWRRVAGSVGCLLLGAGVATLLAALLPGWAWVGAGTGALGTGALVAGLAQLTSGRDRVLALASGLVGAAWLSVGAVAGLTGEGPAVLAGALALAVLAGWGLPVWVVTATGLAADSPEVDVREIAEKAGLAREWLLAGVLAEGVLVVVLAPLVAAAGGWGVGLGVAGSLGLLLQARRPRPVAEVVASAAAGAAGLAAVVAVAGWLHPGWRLPVAGTLCLAGAVTTMLARRPWPSPARRGRLADLTETTARLSLLPLALPACGVFPLVRDLVP